MRPAPCRILALALAAKSVAAQSPFTKYEQTKRLPAGCIDGYTAGTDTVLYTVPYTYAQVLPIIGSFKNLTWSGNPDNTVTLNGSDNTVGITRTYDMAGAHVIETLILYMKPAKGPYAEIHSLAPLTIPALNLSFYSDYDANFAAPVCNGSATLLNETVNFCATNATLAAGVFHKLHLADLSNVRTLLGGQNFSSCAAFGNTTSTNSTSSNASSTSSAATTTVTSSRGASSDGTSVNRTLSTAPSNGGTTIKLTSPPEGSISPTSSQGGASALAASAVIAGFVALGAVFL